MKEQNLKKAVNDYMPYRKTKISTPLGDFRINLSDIDTYPSIEIQFNDERIALVDLDLDDKLLQASLWDTDISKHQYQHTIFHDIRSELESKCLYDPSVERIFNSPKIKRMLKLADKYHGTQVDLAGKPYMNHVQTVALIAAHLTKNEDVVVAAILHDIIEDTSITSNDLLEKGVSETIINAINELSRDKDVDYNEYILKIKHPIARYVKMADLVHNIDLSRFGDDYKPSSGDHQRIKKYRQALVLLSRDQFELERAYDIYENIK